MTSNRDLILSTKKLKPRLSSQLQQLPGFRYHEDDFISITPVFAAGGLAGLDPNAPLVFTSGNALRIAAGYYPAVREFTGIVYTLEGSGDEARKYLPDAQIRNSGHNGEALAQQIVAEMTPGSLSFFCGNKRRDTLPETLRSAGFTLREVQVYETGFAPRQMQEMPATILFFSPSAVESYLMANRLSADTVAIAIGDTTADLLRRQQFGIRILTAQEPSQEAVVDTLLNYLNTIKV